MSKKNYYKNPVNKIQRLSQRHLALTRLGIICHYNSDGASC